MNKYYDDNCNHYHKEKSLLSNHSAPYSNTINQSDNYKSKNELLNKENQIKKYWKIFFIAVFIASVLSIIYCLFNKDNDAGIVAIIVINFILCCGIASFAPLYSKDVNDNKSRKREYNPVNSDPNLQ